MNEREETLPIYFFSSETEINIAIGYEKRLWAIPDGVETYFKSRYTMSRRMVPGSLGIIFCAEKKKCQYFAMPFKVTSFAREEKITSVWPETRALPFDIEPLGNPKDRIESLDMAKRTWKSLENGVNPANKLYLASMLAFTPANIFKSDWEAVLRRTEFYQSS